jgi:hypothetical protein
VAGTHDSRNSVTYDRNINENVYDCKKKMKRKVAIILKIYLNFSLVESFLHTLL